MTENLFEKDSQGHKNDRESFEKRFSDVMFGTVDFALLGLVLVFVLLLPQLLKYITEHHL